MYIKQAESECSQHKSHFILIQRDMNSSLNLGLLMPCIFVCAKCFCF